jgi:hypothetical protein
LASLVSLAVAVVGEDWELSDDCFRHDAKQLAQC